MDKLLGKMKGTESSGSQGITASGGASAQSKGPGAGGATSGAQNEDYLDKGLDMAEKKAGMGGMSRETNEGITDAARSGFEKATGKHVPDKFSN